MMHDDCDKELAALRADRLACYQRRALRRLLFSPSASPRLQAIARDRLVALARDCVRRDPPTGIATI